MAEREAKRQQGKPSRGRDPKPPPEAPPAKSQYKARKETVEPVFGIIREAMGFRHHPVGIEADPEWSAAKRHHPLCADTPR